VRLWHGRVESKVSAARIPNKPRSFSPCWPAPSLATHHHTNLTRRRCKLALAAFKNPRGNHGRPLKAMAGVGRAACGRSRRKDRFPRGPKGRGVAHLKRRPARLKLNLAKDAAQVRRQAQENERPPPLVEEMIYRHSRRAIDCIRRGPRHGLFLTLARAVR